MNINLKRLWKAIVYSTAMYGFIHIAALLLYGAQTGMWEQMNVFSILGLNLFYPQMSQGSLSMGISVCIIICVYVGMYLLVQRDDRHKR